jgi:hypothetical protein
MDVYYALKLGPVASNALNVLNKEDIYPYFKENSKATFNQSFPKV